MILLSDQYLGDSTATVPLFEMDSIYTNESGAQAQTPYQSYAITKDGIFPPRLFPGKSDEHDEYDFITESAEMRRQMVDKRMRKLELLKSQLLEPDFMGDERCETLFLGFGSTHGAIKEAVTMLILNTD